MDKNEDVKGVWMAYGDDGHAAAPFNDELLARRYAMENYLSVEFIPFGNDVYEFTTKKYKEGIKYKKV